MQIFDPAPVLLEIHTKEVTKQSTTAKYVQDVQHNTVWSIETALSYIHIRVTGYYAAVQDDCVQKAS